MKHLITVFKDWHEEIENSVETLNLLKEYADISGEKVSAVLKKYPMKITPYYLSLALSQGAPLMRQVIPDISELDDNSLKADPLSERSMSPVPYLIHRYPDRVVFLISSRCATYCRHCMRKRMVGKIAPLKTSVEEMTEAVVAYISENKQIRDVILSGGDPLLLEDADLLDALTRIRKIKHVDMIRIHTRVPCTLPQRITRSLVDKLKACHPLFVNVQFNHPDEITVHSQKACEMLADAGIPLGSQTVLLKGVNDSPETLTALMRALLKLRIRPYYLHHPDPIKGTSHFRLPLERGLDIMASLRGNISGMCMPQYMIDLPGGGGKVPVLPQYIQKKEAEGYSVVNYQGETFFYRDH